MVCTPVPSAGPRHSARKHAAVTAAGKRAAVFGGVCAAVQRGGVYGEERQTDTVHSVQSQGSEKWRLNDAPMKEMRPIVGDGERAQCQGDRHLFIEPTTDGCCEIHVLLRG